MSVSGPVPTNLFDPPTRSEITAMHNACAPGTEVEVYWYDYREWRRGVVTWRSDCPDEEEIRIHWLDPRGYPPAGTLWLLGGPLG